jgi:glutamyl-tRNA synthetase
VGRGAARFDFKKLENLNGHYLREADDPRLATLAAPRIRAAIDRELTPQELDLLTAAMSVLKVRAKTTIDLAEGALFLFENRPLKMDEKAQGLLEEDSVALLVKAHNSLQAQADWSMDSLEACIKGVAEAENVGLGKVAQPLRAALTGRGTSPGIFDVLVLLGREEALARIGDHRGD